MGTPVFLKFARLVGAVLFILGSANFIYASLSATKHGIALDFAVVEAAQTWSIYMSSGLQLFHNSFYLDIYWTYIINKIRELTAGTAPLSPKRISNLAWTFGSHYILNAVQLATTSFMSAATLIDSAKAVLNIASASVAALPKRLPASAVAALPKKFPVLTVHWPLEKRNYHVSRQKSRFRQHHR